MFINVIFSFNFTFVITSSNVNNYNKIKFKTICLALKNKLMARKSYYIKSEKACVEVQSKKKIIGLVNRAHKNDKIFLAHCHNFDPIFMK